MNDQVVDKLNDIIDKLYSNQKITNEETDLLLNYTRIPAVLKKLLNKDDLFYIDLVGNFELLDELPPNPLDAGGKEHLKLSIQIANKMKDREPLTKNDKEHLIKDLTTPLELIFSGTDEINFKSTIETLTYDLSEEAKSVLTKDLVEALIDKEFKKSFYSIVKKRSTETFLKELEKALINLNTNEATTNEIIEIREFLPDIKSFGYSNTKVENIITNPARTLREIIEKEAFKAEIANDKDKKAGLSYPVEAKFFLMDDTIIPNNFNYTSSIRRLVSAVGNAYDYAELETKAAGAKSVRVDHLINIMDGKPATTRVRAERVQEVTDQIKTLRNISIEIDATPHREYNNRNPRKPQLEQSKFTGFLLPVEIIERKEFSEDKQVYISILKRPALYEYAREAGQIITVDNELLDLTTYPKNNLLPIYQIKRATQQTSSLRDLMILETKGRGRNKDYTMITYDRIYKYIDDDLGRQVRRQTLNKNIEKVAQTLKAKGEFTKIEIKPKGKKRYGTLILYK